LTPITVIGNLISTMEDAMAISAELGETLEAYVGSLVKTGRYNSKSEVLREGVRLVQEREAKLAALDAALAEGVADIEAGRTVPMEQVFDELEARYREIVATRGA
jgi:antitoxin ParD1/3/4